MATFSSNAGRYTLILDAYENSGSTNITNNTSSVHWTLKLRSDSGYCQWNPGPGDFHVKLNGSVVWSAENPALWYGSIGGTITLASGDTTIGHNSDGSKTIYCEGKYTANSNADYLPKSSTCGGNLTLSTIPRASSFKSISGNTIGGSQTITIDRKSSSFTHSLWYKIGNGSWVGIGSGIGTSKTWTLPTSLNNQIPNSTSLTLTYILRTYNGTTQIGSDVYYDYTVYYSGNNPNVGSVAITYANLFNSKFIANHSTATIKYTGYGGVYGSSIKSAQVIFNGGWKGTTNYDTGKLTAGTYTFQGVVTDSRNKTVYTGQQSFTCHQINNPTISINAYRSDAEGNADPGGTYITIIPTYSAHDPVGGNSIKTNSFTCTSLMTTGTAITSGAKKILSGANVDSEYVISGTVTDQLGRSSATSIKVGTAFAIMDIRPDERGMSFGKYSTGPDKFEVGWDTYFDKDLDILGTTRIRGSSWTTSNSRHEGGIVFNNSVGSWISLRNNAAIRTTVVSNSGAASSIASLKTINGSWQIAGLGDDLYFTYITDADVNAGNNRNASSVRIASNGLIYGTVTRANAANKMEANGVQIYESNGIIWGSAGGKLNKLMSKAGNMAIEDGKIYFDNDLVNIKWSSGTGGDESIIYYPKSGKGYFGVGSDSGMTDFTILRGNGVRIYAHHGYGVYLGASGSVAITSDENLKDIYTLDNKYFDFFKKIVPVTYKYKDVGHRLHMGFGARQVEKALKDSGLTTEQFAGVVIDKNITIDADEAQTDEDVFYDELYSLRYEEFIALNTFAIQKILHKLEQLERKGITR